MLVRREKKGGGLSKDSYPKDMALIFDKEDERHAQWLALRRVGHRADLLTVVMTNSERIDEH